MQSTMELLEKALEKYPAQHWHKKFNLNRNVLHVSRNRGRLSPVVAGVLAVELGESALEWIAISAIEAERDSGAKDYLMKKIKRGGNGGIRTLDEAQHPILP